MVLCRMLPCVTGVKRGRVDPGVQERQEGEVRNAVPPRPPPFPSCLFPRARFPFPFPLERLTCRIARY